MNGNGTDIHRFLYSYLRGDGIESVQRLGKADNYMAQCTLAVNMINEKIFNQ